MQKCTVYTTVLYKSAAAHSALTAGVAGSDLQKLLRAWKTTSSSSSPLDAMCVHMLRHPEPQSLQLILHISLSLITRMKIEDTKSIGSHIMPCQAWPFFKIRHN